jgi:hypothetical protein
MWEKLQTRGRALLASKGIRLMSAIGERRLDQTIYFLRGEIHRQTSGTNESTRLGAIPA